MSEKLSLPSAGARCITDDTINTIPAPVSMVSLQFLFQRVSAHRIVSHCIGSINHLSIHASIEASEHLSIYPSIHSLNYQISDLTPLLPPEIET